MTELYMTERSKSTNQSVSQRSLIPSHVEPTSTASPPQTLRRVDVEQPPPPSTTDLTSTSITMSPPAPPIRPRYPKSYTGVAAAGAGTTTNQKQLTPSSSSPINFNSYINNLSANAPP